ncbi:MAG: type II methionyl aminopeptidase [Candidatus Heimdallarchaeaceae archaeon]
MNESFEKYKKSGHILAKALEYAKGLAKPGIKLLDIAEKTEDYIRGQSAVPAFPVNISINDIAAHYSPRIEDDSIIPEASIVKIDAGVSVDGYLTDAARTLVFDEKWLPMKNLARKALNSALDVIKANESVFRIGEIIQKTIEEEGFKPIVNLSGHSLSYYSLHDGISIPNYSVSKEARDSTHVFKMGKAYAIEPFVTSGIGRVVDTDQETIFRHYRKIDASSLSGQFREIYRFIDDNFNGLPFSWRWVYNAGFSKEKTHKIRNFLLKRNIVHGYPVLIEATNAPVTQEEETVYVDEDRVHILTKNN